MQTCPVQIKLKSEEKKKWENIANNNGFLSIPTMIRYLVVQYEKQNRKNLDFDLAENLEIVKRIKNGTEQLFSGNLYELAEKYGD